MLSKYTVMTNIKAALDGDATMDTLLERETESKVILGAEVPGTAAPPLVNLADMPDNVEDFQSGWTRFILGVVVRTENISSDQIDYEAFSNIGSRIHALLNKQDISGTKGVYYQGSLGATPDLELDSVSLIQYRYLILAT